MPTNDWKAFTIRMDAGLADQLQKRADISRRSRSAESVFLIKWALDEQSRVLKQEQEHVSQPDQSFLPINEWKAFTIRMDAGLTDQLQKRAEISHRSRSAESVFLIQWALDEQSRVLKQEQERVAKADAINRADQSLQPTDP